MVSLVYGCIEAQIITRESWDPLGVKTQRIRLEETRIIFPVHVQPFWSRHDIILYRKINEIICGIFSLQFFWFREHRAIPYFI